MSPASAKPHPRASNPTPVGTFAESLAFFNPLLKTQYGFTIHEFEIHREFLAEDELANQFPPLTRPVEIIPNSYLNVWARIGVSLSEPESIAEGTFRIRIDKDRRPHLVYAKIEYIAVDKKTWSDTVKEQLDKRGVDIAGLIVAVIAFLLGR